MSLAVSINLLLLLLSLWSTTFASAISPENITKGNIKDKEKTRKTNLETKSFLIEKAGTKR